MSFVRRLLAGRRPGPGLTPVHIAEPRFDDWVLVGEFDSVAAARTYHQHLSEAGFEPALTSDWPLDRFGRGDIALRVPAEQWSDADAFLTGSDLD